MVGQLTRISCWIMVSLSLSQLVSSRSLIDKNDSLGKQVAELLTTGFQELSLTLLLLLMILSRSSFSFTSCSQISRNFGLDLIQSENLAVLRFSFFLELLGLARPDSLNSRSSSVSLGLYLMQGERQVSSCVTSSTASFQKCTIFDFFAQDLGMLLSEQMLFVWTGLLLSIFSSSESVSSSFQLWFSLAPKLTQVLAFLCDFDRQLGFGISFLSLGLDMVYEKVMESSL